MERNVFFEAIKDSFFEEVSADIDDFKKMVKGAMPVFGTLEMVIKDTEEGKTITFIDHDEADIVIGPEGVNMDEINTDMTTELMTLTLDQEGIVKTVSHGISGFFTQANKEQVLLLASFIGKRILIEEKNKQ